MNIQLKIFGLPPQLLPISNITKMAIYIGTDTNTNIYINIICNIIFVMKEYLGDVISLFSKVVDHQQVCYLGHAGNLYDEHT